MSLLRRLVAALALLGAAPAAYAFGLPVAQMSVSDPRTIHGCAAWQRSDYGITVATGVSVWRDQSGNSANARQTTGADQPAYSTSGLNGRPKLTFDGVQSYMTWNASVSGAQTAVFVVKGNVLPASTAATYYQVFQVASASGGATLNGFFELGLVGYPEIEFTADVSGTTTSYQGTNGTADTSPHVWVVTYNGAGNTTFGNYQYFLDSAVQSGGTSGAITAGVSGDGSVIGAVERSGGFSAYAPMDFYEIALWPRVLTADEIVVVDAYEKKLYGL